MPFAIAGTVIPLDAPFTHPETGVQFPANWIRLASPDEREAIGLEELPEPPAPPDQRFYWGYDADGALIPKQLDDETTEDEEGNSVTTTGLKTQWISQTKTTAGQLLAATDWVVVRAAEPNGKPASESVLTHRSAIRAASNEKEAAILACTTVDELVAYITGPGTLVEDPETGEMVPDPTTAYSYWPAA